MAQAGIHSMVGLAVRKWIPESSGLAIGIVLGNLLPDVDNLAVAVATVTGKPTEGLHRTFTHSIFSVIALMIVFYLIGRWRKRLYWGVLGFGLGLGVLMHILLDLVIWFNGVEVFWPLPVWVNFWSGVSVPEWFSKLLMPVEFLFFALYFIWLWRTALDQETNLDFLRLLRVWVGVEAGLFIVFTLLVYILERGFMVPYGAVYLLSLGLAFWVTVRMSSTVETARA